MSHPFDALKFAAFHCVSAGPHEPRCDELRRSDIVLHLPVLEYFASKCGHVTEFGVRDGCSTVALISGCRGHVHSYDIERTPIVDRLQRTALPCSSWTFHLGDTGDPSLEVAETDLLFIDTLHTYAHVSKELAYHGRKARKYLAFHDTLTCGARDLSGPDPAAEGITRAIEEFLARHPGEYREAFRTDWSNGLLVLERV